MRRCGVAFGLLLTACGVDLRLAPDTVVSCESDSECPLGLTCNAEARRCVAAEDAGALLITQVAATSSFRVVVVFNKPLAPGPATSADRYRVSPGISIDEAVLEKDDTVVLYVSELKARTYELTVEGLTDIFGYVIADSDTKATFVGIGDLVDAAPPKLLAPPDKSNFAGASEVTLQWTPVLEAESYFVTVAYDAAFTRLHPSTPADGYFTTTNPTLTVSVVAERAYFWKVTSTANEGESTIGRYAAVTSEVFVFCADGDSCAPPATPLWEAGTRELPFASPARAVDAASLFGAGTVKIATRGNGSYRDGMLLRGNIAVLGGWDATFTTRDPTLYPTAIRVDTLAVQVIENAGPVLVDGLVLGARLGGEALLLANCDDSVVISHCTLSGGDDAFAIAIDSSPRAGPIVRDSVVLDDVVVRGVTAPTFERDYFDNGTSLSFIGGTRGVVDHSFFSESSIRTQEGAACADLRISSNVMTNPGEGALQLGGIFCGSVEVVNNQIWSGSSLNSETQGFGIKVVGDADPTATLRITHNTIVVGGGQVAAPIDILGTTVAAANNLLVCVSSPTSSGIYTQGGGPIVRSIENNAFVGCAAALTVGNAPMPTLVYATEAELDGLDGGGVAGTRSHDNVVVGLTHEEVFIDFDGTIALPETLFLDDVLDNDWRLALDTIGSPNRTEQLRIVSGGKDTSAATCGSYEAPISCGNVAVDFAGSNRTSPPSIGAYERDP